MSDEESFVILGSSPMPSMRSECAQESLVSNCSSLNLGEIKPETSAKTSLANNDASIKSINGTNDKSLKQSAICSPKSDASLAASFIMGEVNADVLKESLYSQLPCAPSMEACAEDVVKLQNLMTEYIELKNTLAKVNTTMKQFYSKTQQWRDETQLMEQNYKEQLQSCQLQIATLRNENIDLKRELNNKIEQMKNIEELCQKEHADLVKELSAKSAQMSNMMVQIEKLEMQQLTSFEYVAKNEFDSKEKPDYVDRLEHERIVKQFERQLSELLAENLDLKDMQKQYHSEIDCLKVNLTAAEELLKQSRADINMLKAKDMEKSESFTQFEADRNQMREEINLLRQQVDVYSKDFEMERTARQTLAGEKDQLTQDLRALQRKNHSLIEEIQKQIEKTEQTRKSPSPATASAPVATVTVTETETAAPDVELGSTPSMCCPVCAKQFPNYAVLNSHVNDCLDSHN